MCYFDGYVISHNGTKLTCCLCLMMDYVCMSVSVSKHNIYSTFTLTNVFIFVCLDLSLFICLPGCVFIHNVKQPMSVCLHNWLYIWKLLYVCPCIHSYSIIFTSNYVRNLCMCLSICLSRWSDIRYCIMHMELCLYVRMFVCQSACLYVCMSVRCLELLYMHTEVHLYVCMTDHNISPYTRSPKQFNSSDKSTSLRSPPTYIF